MNAARYFQRREDYQPLQTSSASPFRRFDVKCLACGSYQLRLVAQFDDEAGEMAVVLTCTLKLTWGRQVRENPLHLTPCDYN